MKITALLLLVGVIIACQAEEGDIVASSIQDVKRKYEAELMSQPGVVSVGIGKSDNGELTLVVGLDGREQTSASRFPDELEGYPVHVQVIGPVRAQ